MNISELITQLEHIKDYCGDLPVKHVSYQVAGSSVQPIVNAAVVESGVDNPVYVVLES